MGGPVGSVDLPDQSDEPSRAERARDACAARSQMREMPDPDERGRAYEATRAHVSAETAERAGQGRPPDAAEQGSYWDEVPRFREMWAGHEGRWPERQPAAEPDRSAASGGRPCPARSAVSAET